MYIVHEMVSQILVTFYQHIFPFLTVTGDLDGHNEPEEAADEVESKMEAMFGGKGGNDDLEATEATEDEEDEEDNPG